MIITRKVYHFFGGISLIIIYKSLNKENITLIYGAILLLVFTLELIRIRYKPFNTWLYRHFGHMFKPEEKTHFTGTIPFILGTTLTLYLFPFPLALAAILFLITGDMCAAFVGKKWGTYKIKQKTLEGSIAFFITALLITIPVCIIYKLRWIVALTGVIVATLTELFTPKILDDNLTIPLSSAFIMMIAMKLV